MKLLPLLLLFGSCLFLYSCTTQPNYQPISITGHKWTPYITYYPYYKGVQLIELDFIRDSIMVSRAKKREVTSISLQKNIVSQNYVRSGLPIISFEHEFSISYNLAPNAYVVRNKQGKIVAHYNINKEDLQRYQFLPPNQSKQLEKNYHLNKHAAYFLQNQQQFYQYKIISNQGIGIIDTFGSIVLEPIYDSVGVYENSSYCLFQQGKVALVDKDLETIVPANYERIVPFENDLYQVEQNGLIGLCNDKGEELLSPKYKEIQVMPDGGYKIYNGQWGVLDEHYKKIIPPKYDKVSPFEKGWYQVEQEGLVGLLDEQGKKLCPVQYVAISNFEEGCAIVYKGGKFGFINSKMQEIGEIKYDFVHPFHKEVAIVVKEGKYGFINKKGKELVQCLFKKIDYYHENLLKVETMEGKFGLYNTKGIACIVPLYDRLPTYWKYKYKYSCY